SGSLRRGVPTPHRPGSALAAFGGAFALLLELVEPAEYVVLDGHVVDHEHRQQSDREYDAADDRQPARIGSGADAEQDSADATDDGADRRFRVTLFPVREATQ